VKRELPFNPFFLFKTAFQQTIMGTFLKVAKEPISKTKLITLKDKDKIALEITTPKKWKESDLTVILIHGFCGSHKSPGLVRMARKLEAKKVRAIRLNLRGCGSGKGLAKNTYYSGNHEDIFEVLKVLKEEFPKSPMVLVGFSLGGNLALKMAGEMREDLNKYIRNLIALSPPVDLKLSVNFFKREENKVYLKYFAKILKEDIDFLKKTFLDFPDINLPEDMTLSDFNSLFVVPFFGYKDLDEYYEKCSSKYVVKNIKIPCKILFSEDDPLVSFEGLKGIEIPKNIEVFLTKKGGHLGYIASLKDKKGFFWLDNILLDWILN
jgi:hypothetical protein